MNEKIASLLVLGALVIGYPLGVMISRFVEENRLLARLGAFAGVVMAFVGLTGGPDLRYLILAELGLYLQLAWLVASFRFKRTAKPQYMELWASHREPNKSPDATTAPGTHPAL